MNNVHYIVKNDIPSQLLKNLAQTLGWKTNISPITEEQLLDSVFNNGSNNFSGVGIGQTPEELNYQYYRNLILNSAYLFKSKGTRKSIEILLRLIGAPEMLVEFNLSCPNTDNEIPGYSIKFLESLLVSLICLKLTKIRFGFKLPPYFQKQEITNLCKIFNDCNSILSYIVVSNSIPNCLPLNEGSPVLLTNFGGMSGKINKYIALGNVVLFSQNLNKKIKIVGCGGIDSIDDINDYLNNGADFVQLASCFYDQVNNKLNIEKINNLINNYLKI